MPLFGRGLSSEQKAEMLSLVVHLEILYAFQQLGMERYNDAMALLLTGPIGSELAHQQFTGIASPEAAREYVLPAITFKLAIINEMHRRHVQFGRSAVSEIQKAYDSCSAMIDVMGRRAAAQNVGWETWVADPAASSVDTRQLDVEEAEAIQENIKDVNNLIFDRLKMSHDDLRNIIFASMNTVREIINEAPLSISDFEAIQEGTLSGRPVRYFS